jgi:hypothetical protein
MEEMRNPYNILVGKPEGRYLSEYLVVGRIIILECILGKRGG